MNINQMAKETGVVIDIEDDDEGEFVHIRTNDSIVGLHISTCKGFRPEVGQVVRVSTSEEVPWEIIPI